MAFFDNIGKRAAEIANNAVQKTQEISEVARINSLIAEEEKKLTSTYYQIGKLYATLHSTDAEDEFIGMLSAIKDAERKINDFRQQIETIKGIRRCEKCGAEVSNGFAHCPACGTPMPKLAEPALEHGIRCPRCGRLMEPGMRFCTGCGEPMTQLPMAPSPVYPATPAEPLGKICPNCGSKMDEDTIFCTECGNKL